MKKILLITLGAGFSLFLLLVLGLWLFFPYDQVREKLATEMSAALETKVEIASLDFSLLPRVNVSLGGVSIGEEPTAKLPKVDVAELRVGVPLLPLLSKNVVVEEVLIREPKIEILLSEEEAPKEKKAEPAQETAKVPYDFNLEKLLIRDLQLIARKPNGDEVLRIENLSETLSASATTGGILSLEGLLEVEDWQASLPMGQVGRGLSIEFKKKLSFDLNTDELKIEEAKLSLGDLPLSVSGNVSNVRDEKKRAIDMKFSGGPANVEKIMGYIPVALLPKEAKDVTSSGKVELKGFAKGMLADKPDFSVAFSLENGKIAAPILPAPIEGIEVRLSATPKMVELSTFTAKTVTSSVNMNAKVSGYDQKTPSVKGAMKANVNLADVAVLHTMEKGDKLAGSVQVDATFDGKLAPESDLTSAATGKVTFSKVSFASPKLPANVKSIDGSMQLDRGDFKMPGLKVAIGESDLTFKGYMNQATSLMNENATDPVKFDFALSSKRLNLDELIPATKEEDPESKELQLPKPLERLVGEARLSVDSLRVNKLEAKNAKGKVSVKRGVLTLDGFKMNAFSGAMALKGTIDYKNPKSPKFDLAVNVDKVQVSEFFGYAQNLNKLARIGTYLKGSFSADTKLDGSLKEDLSLNLGDLSSVGKLQMKGGEFAGHPLQTKVASYLNAPSLKELPVRDWLAPFEIKKGKLEIKNLKLAAKGVGVDLSGWQSINGNTKMDLNLDLPKSAARGIQKHVPKQVSSILLGGKDGNLTLPFEVGGQVTDPSLSLKQDALAAQAKDRAAEKVAAEKKKAEKKLKSKAKSSVNKLLGNDTKKSDEKKKSTKDAAKDKAKGLIKDLF